jgi:hypothetical protein
MVVGVPPGAVAIRLWLTTFFPAWHARFGTRQVRSAGAFFILILGAVVVSACLRCTSGSRPGFTS